MMYLSQILWVSVHHVTSSMSDHFHTVVAEVLPVGVRPPTESLLEVRLSKLLDCVVKKKSTVFADGNSAWRTEARRLGLRHVEVCHQRKEFVRKDRKKKGQTGSCMAGTQKLDRCWQALKKFVPQSFPRKLGKAEASRLHPAMPLFVEQFMWRKSVGNVTAQGFLSELVKIFQSRGRN